MLVVTIPDEPRELKREVGRLRTRVVVEFADGRSVALVVTREASVGRVGVLKRMRAAAPLTDPRFRVFAFAITFTSNHERCSRS
jgi:hypothetical protein